jgi:hypothetical protein
MEVREVRGANSGRDPFPIMLRRQKLPKVLRNLDDMPGATPIGISSTANHDNVYTWRDMRVGETINVLGRQVLLYDCDEYTRSFLTENLGLSRESLQAINIRPQNAKANAEQHVQVEQKKTSLQKLLENDGKVFRFLAFLDSHRREDRARRFVLSFRLADDTISVYEPPVKNAGLMGGKFAERATLTNPNTGKPYDSADFHVGATIEVRHAGIVMSAHDFRCIATSLSCCLRTSTSSTTWSKMPQSIRNPTLPRLLPSCVPRMPRIPFNRLWPPRINCRAIPSFKHSRLLFPPTL